MTDGMPSPRSPASLILMNSSMYRIFLPPALCSMCLCVLLYYSSLITTGRNKLLRTKYSS